MCQFWVLNFEQKHWNGRKGKRKRAEMNSLEIIPDDEWFKQRRYFRASNRQCPVLQGCRVDKVGAGDSLRSKNRCSDSKVKKNYWSDGETPVFKIQVLEPWLNSSVGCPVHQKVEGSILGQGTYLGCGFDPWSEHIWEAASPHFSHTDVSLSLSLSLSLSPSLSLSLSFSLPPSVSKINKHIIKWGLKKDIRGGMCLCLVNSHVYWLKPEEK